MKKLNTTFTLYTFFMLGAAVLGMAKLTIYAKLLNVESFGLYSLVLSSYIFIMYAGSFGLSEALVKHGSMAYGRGDTKQINELYGVALIYGTSGILFGSLLILVFIGLFIEDSSITSMFLLMAALALSTFEFNLINSYLRVSHKFVMFSFMLFAKALLVIMLAFYIVPVWGVNGAVLIEMAVLVLLAVVSIYVSRPYFDYKIVLRDNFLFRRGVKHGFPVMLSTVIRNLTMSIDRWIIAISLGVVALGKYAFAMILFQAGMVGIGFISTILGTKWLAEFGKNSNLTKMLVNIKKIMLPIFILSFTLAWPFLSFILYLVDIYYPAYSYQNVTLTIVFVYFGVVFLSLSSLLDWLFIASSNEKILLKFSLYSLVLTTILMLFCYLFNAEIHIYAFVFLIVRMFNLLLSLVTIPSLLRCKVMKV